MPESPEAHRDTQVRYRRKQSASARDIGWLPSVQDRGKKAGAEVSLERFCLSYQPEIFTRPFSPMHREVIDRLETAIDTGGLFAYAMPRGTGKTSIAEAACIWALLTGRRRYVVLISATERLAQQSLDNIKSELSGNPLLYADYPEVVFPIASLEGIAHRAGGQTFLGESTHLVWRGERLSLPTIPGSKASGSVIEVRGITSGGVRGMKANLPDGRGAIRPELVILDDPQTDESARSPTQCRTRQDIILNTILGLSGHEHQMSAVMPCTVICRGDLAERFLDSDEHPEWHGVRRSLLVSMPTNMKLWDEYAEIHRDDPNEANIFYSGNLEEMDKGAEASWEECFNEDRGQLSAIQYAMDLKYRVGDAAFWAEYQNQPLIDAIDGELVGPEDIEGKKSGYKQWEIPADCEYLTSAIDVHKDILYYMVCGWNSKFDGSIVSYGTWPKQRLRVFAAGKATETLQNKYPGKGMDGAIYAGLEELVNNLLSRHWGQSGLSINLCLIDANWRTSLVKSYCRRSQFPANVIATHGRYIGAARKALNEYRKAAGDRVGEGWRIPGKPSREGVRHVIFDTNFWKSHVNTSLLTPFGNRGCLQVFNGNHDILIEHLTSEYFKEVSGRGRTVHEWILHPGRQNHWFDNLVACAVGASMCGCELIESARPRSVLSGKKIRVLGL